MGPIEFVALLLAGVGPLLALSHALRLPATVVLFAAGLGAGLLPGPAPVRVDPDLVIWLFLPPVIYAGTVRVTPHLLRVTLLPGVLVGVVTSLCIVLAVAVVLRMLLLPGLGWTAALALGVVAALFDTRLFHEADGRPHVPRALGDALKAREMAARVTALVALKLTLDALAAGQAPGLGEAVLDIAWSLAGGAAVGAVIARAVLWLRDRAGPAPVEIAVSLATPYLTALAARGLGLSLAVAVIAAALTVAAARVDRKTGEARSSAEARITAAAFWEELSLIASSVLFFLAGLALPDAWASLGDWPGWRTAGAAAGIVIIALALQGVGSLVSTRLPPLRDALEGPGSTLRAAGVMAWASTQSVLGLVVALSIPPAARSGELFSERGLVVVVASLVILSSVAVQGLTLRAAVRHAGLGGEDEAQREEEEARNAAAAARQEAPAEDTHPDSLAAERRALLHLREHDEIGDEALRSLLREADLRDRAAEGDGRTGAGPPNP
ncbi:MAG: sodium/hydrogen exchanger [Rhodospirillales bacterium]|nr:sodium/hydrogen exchanger [Rhodospirillales bacterium]